MKPKHLSNCLAYVDTYENFCLNSILLVALSSKYIQSSTISYHLHSCFHGLPNWLANSLLLFSTWQIEQSLKLWVRLCDSFAHSYPGSSYLGHNIKPDILFFFLATLWPLQDLSFTDHGSYLCLLHWDHGPLDHQGSPIKPQILIMVYEVSKFSPSHLSPLILLSPCLLPHSHSLYFSHIGPIPIPASVPCMYCFLGLAVSFCRQPQGSLFHHIWNRCPPCISILFTLFNLSS